MSNNPFGIGRIGTNKVNVIQLENRIAYQFRSGINEPIPPYDPLSETPQPTTTPIPLPNNSLTTKYFNDAAITSDKIATSIAFPYPPILNTDDPAADNRPSTIAHVRNYVIQGLQELNYGDKIDELLGSFSDTLAEIPPRLPPRDTSINLIDQPDWVIETRIADQAILGPEYDASSPLPSHIEIAATTYITGPALATTTYTREILANFIADTDASLSSIGKIARSIASMTDASFTAFSAEKTDRIVFDASYVSLTNSQHNKDLSLNILLSLNQVQTYTTTQSTIDNSLAQIYVKDASLLAFTTGSSLFPSIETMNSKYSHLDSSFSILKTHADVSLGQIFADGWTPVSAFDASLTLVEATLANGPTDASSNQVATTSYVKLRLSTLANSSVLSSYAQFAAAVGGDASFAYSVIQRSNQLDASVVYLSNKIATIENNGEQQYFIETGKIENLERKFDGQDISLGFFSIASFQQNTDTSLNSISIKYRTEHEPAVNLSIYDSCLNSLNIQLQNSLQRRNQIEGNADASFLFLGNKFNEQNSNLIANDISLAFLLNSRENKVDSSFTQIYSHFNPRFQNIDGLLSGFAMVSDASFSGLNARFNTADSSAILFTATLADISSNISTILTPHIDSSLVFLREEFQESTISLDRIGEDQSLNYLIKTTQNTDISLNMIISNFYSTMGARTGSLDTTATGNYLVSDSSLQGISFGIQSRETQWGNQTKQIDASFERQVADYNGLNTAQQLRQTRIAGIDSSFIFASHAQTIQLNSVNNHIGEVSIEKFGAMAQLDNSASYVDQIISNLDYSVLDTATNTMIQKVAIHDNSLVAINVPQWVRQVANSLTLPVATTVAIGNDASGTEPANTAFFKNRVDEFVGFPVAPFSHLNALAYALNNTGNYSQWIEADLNEIGSQLATFNLVLNTLTSNTGGEFSYDASINYLTEKLNSLDMSAANIFARLAASTQTDTSLATFYSRQSGVESSLYSLLRWDNSAASISLSQVQQENTIVNTNESTREKSSTTDTSLNMATNKLGTVAGNIVAKKTQIGDLSLTYLNQTRVLDTSSQILRTKYGNIRGKTAKFVERDASFSAISSSILSVKNGVESYLGNSVESSSYYATLNMLYNRIVARDTSINAIATKYDSSFSVVSNIIVGQDQSYNALYDRVATQTENKRNAVLSVSLVNRASLEAIDASGWVVSGSLNSGIVLPTGVRISTVGNTGIASAANVKTAIMDVIGAAGPALDTLGEFAAALNQDTNLANTLYGRISATDSSFHILAADLSGRIFSVDDKQRNQINSIGLLPYNAIVDGVKGFYPRLQTNDVSTNLAGTNISTVNGKTQTVFRRLATNDGSTNVLDGRITTHEGSLNLLDLSIFGEEGVSATVDSSFTGIRTIATQVNVGLLANDLSTNTLPQATTVRETSANVLVSLLGTPTNFVVGATTTTSLTCNYTEPVLRDAIGVNNYRITATPIYGAVSTVVRDVSAGVSQVQVAGLSSGAVYDLSLAARNPYGTVVVAGISGTTALFPPTGLVGSASTVSSFTVGWSSGGGTVANYVFGLKNGEVDVTGGTVSSATTSRNFTGLLDGTSYLFSVRSTNPYVASADASLIYGTIFTAPSSITFSSRTANSLSFSAAGTTKPYSRYNIAYRPLGGTTVSTTDTSSNFTLSGLLGGRIYDVSVNIQNAYGSSDWVTTRNSTTLSVPTLSVGTITGSSIVVNFSSALAVQDCSYVLRTDPNVTQYVLAPGIASQTLTGLAGGTLYNIYLDASNAFLRPFSTTSATTSSPSPLNITGCILWLDSTDSSTLTLSGSNVIQWNDKSTNAKNMTIKRGSGPTQSTINSKNILNFSGSTPGTELQNTSFAMPTVYTIIGVGYTTQTGYRRMVAGVNDFGTFFGTSEGNFATFVGSPGGGWNDTNANTPNISVSTLKILAMTNNNAAAGLIPYVNGSEQTAKNGSTKTFTALCIGGGECGSDQTWRGFIGEVIIYNSVLSTTNRQFVENYLKAKWGLTY